MNIESYCRRDTIVFKFIDIMDVIDERVGFELMEASVPPDIKDVWASPRPRHHYWVYIKKSNLKFIDWEKKEATITC